MAILTVKLPRVNQTLRNKSKERKQNNTFFEETKIRFWRNNFCQPNSFENMKKDRHQFQIKENLIWKSLVTLSSDLYRKSHDLEYNLYITRIY